MKALPHIYKVLASGSLLLLGGCTSPEGCSTEPYYRHANNEADINVDDKWKDSPLSQVHVGAGCDSKSFILRKTIPVQIGKP